MRNFFCGIKKYKKKKAKKITVKENISNIIE